MDCNWVSTVFCASLEAAAWAKFILRKMPVSTSKLLSKLAASKQLLTRTTAPHRMLYVSSSVRPKLLLASIIHTCSLFSYGEENVNGMTVIYIVMPYRREGSFINWLQQRGDNELLSVQDVAYFISQAADALQYAHENQIVHQDVKPSNFLIRTNKGRSKLPDLLLADFGIARLSASTSSASHAIRGTPTYMAPEQWSGEPV